MTSKLSLGGSNGSRVSHFFEKGLLFDVLMADIIGTDVLLLNLLQIFFGFLVVTGSVVYGLMVSTTL